MKGEGNEEGHKTKTQYLGQLKMSNTNFSNPDRKNSAVGSFKGIPILDTQNEENEGEASLAFDEKSQANLKDRQAEKTRRARKKCILRRSDPIKSKLDILVMVMAVFNVFSIPFAIAFEPAEFDTLEYKIVNYISDFVFLLDLLANCRTTFPDKQTGKEVKNGKVMFIAYLKSSFIFDLLATVPIDDLISVFIETDNNYAQLFGIIKLGRVMRLSRIITYLNTTKKIKAFLKLSKLIFFLIMYLHCFACAWWIVVKGEQTWIPVYLYNESDFYSLYQDDQAFQYLSCMSTSVMLLTGQDPGMRQETHFAIGIFGLFMGQIINANILGELAVLVAELNQQEAEFQSRIDTANTSMQNLRLPTMLQERVRAYMIQNQASYESQVELKQFLQMISPSIRMKVLNYEFHLLLTRMPLFEGEDLVVQKIIHTLEIQLFYPEQEIIKQHEESFDLFFLTKGFMEVIRTNNKNIRKLVTQLDPGSMFGEIGAVYKRRRDATIRSKNFCSAGRLDPKDFDTIMISHPEFLEKLKNQIFERYQTKEKKYFKRVLRRIDYFKAFQEDSKLLEELYYQSKIEQFQYEQKVFNAGDNCQYIQLVLKGVVEIIIEEKFQQFVLDTLCQGSIIGSYSILSQESYSYAARIGTFKGATILLLSAKLIEDMRMANQTLDNNLRSIEDFLEKQGVPQIDYQIYKDKSRKAVIEREEGLEGKIQQSDNKGMETQMSQSAPLYHQQLMAKDKNWIRKEVAIKTPALANFQRAIHRLTILNKVHRKKGLDFTNLMMELQGMQNAKNAKPLTWVEEMVSKIKGSQIITPEMMETYQEKLGKIKDLVNQQDEVLDQLEAKIDLLD